MNRQQRLDLEKQWYTNNIWIKKNHILQKWPFVHPARHSFAYRYMRDNTRKAIVEYLTRAEAKKTKKEEMHFTGRTHRGLVAPCGTTADQDILAGLAKEFHGIDISDEALKHCPKNIITKEGDILKSGYDGEYFNFIASFLFFHHLHKVGFEPFLNEFNRILKPGGALFILEPSVLYPIAWLMWLGRKIFGNISGLMPDEAPVLPGKLSLVLIKAGFKIEQFESVSFSHVRIPLSIQILINKIPTIVRKTSPFNKMGWMCVWICKKIEKNM